MREDDVEMKIQCPRMPFVVNENAVGVLSIHAFWLMMITPLGYFRSAILMMEYAVVETPW
jgi:hypothetical protein